MALFWCFIAQFETYLAYSGVCVLDFDKVNASESRKER